MNSAQYGATPSNNLLESKPQKKDLSHLRGGVIGCIVAPLFIFICVYYLRGMYIRYQIGEETDLALCVLFLLAAFGPGGMAFAAFKKPSNGGDPRLLALMFVSCIFAWTAAFFCGDLLYKSSTQPYADIQNLNSYPNVNPSVYTGAQLMDAGQIYFTPGTQLNLSLSVGFKNDDIYCVAPIVGPKTDATHKPRYDFWAVGLNCCSGHAPDFRCGEYNNRHASAGLRLMREDERGFFRLAVQEAVASYSIEVIQPVFMYWMESPRDEIMAYQDDSNRYFCLGIMGYFTAQVLLTLFGVLGLTFLDKTLV